MIPGASAVGQKAGEYLLSRLGSVDQDAEACARLLVVARAATAGGQYPQGLLSQVQGHFVDAVAQQYRKAHMAWKRRQGSQMGTASIDRRIRMYRAAALDARNLRPEADLCELQRVPDVLGMSAMEASWILDQVGARHEFKDLCGQRRQVSDLKGWEVLKQDHQPGSAVTRGVIWLRVKKCEK